MGAPTIDRRARAEQRWMVRPTAVFMSEVRSTGPRHVIAAPWMLWCTDPFTCTPGRATFLSSIFVSSLITLGKALRHTKTRLRLSPVAISRGLCHAPRVLKPEYQPYCQEKHRSCSSVAPVSRGCSIVGAPIAGGLRWVPGLFCSIFRLWHPECTYT